MAAYVNANNAFSTLAGNITPSDTSFTLAVGNSFPVVTGGDWSYVTFQDLANNIEIVKVTGHTDGANTFSCVRAQENTPARSWIAGDTVECRFTAGTTVTVDGVQTLTNKTFTSSAIRFSDGSLASPGITWANEPTTGFARIGGTVMAVSINTVNTMQWQPGHTFVNSQLNMPNSGAIAFYNAGSGALWEVLHGNAANTLHVGRVGWGSTTIYGGGAGNVYVHGGGVQFAGNVTGISSAMVGLGNLYNRQQIQELRPGVNLMYMGWNGSQIDVQVDNNYMGGTWPISISGNAATSSTTNAANIANNSNAVNGIGGWTYANVKNDPVYVWASDGSTGYQFLAHRPSLHVSYADTAGYASTAGSVSGGGGGVTMINGAQGQLHILAGANIRVDTAGGDITITGLVNPPEGGTDGLRAKDNITDSVTNASAAIGAVRIIEFKDKLANRHVSTGFLPANLETIDSGMVYRTVFPGDPQDGPKDTLNVNPIMMLAYAVKALQEVIARIEALEAR